MRTSIIVVTLSAFAGGASAPTGEDVTGKFFNGKDISAWECDKKEMWSVENGEIVGKSPNIEENVFLLNPMKMGDFRLIVDVKVTDNATNSGIQFRSRWDEPSQHVIGYQADIGEGWWGKIFDEGGERGLLTETDGDKLIKPNEWNTYEILAVGHKIQMALNGKLCSDLDDPKGATEGIIALQLHGGYVMEARFRNFSVELNPEFKLKTVK